MLKLGKKIKSFFSRNKVAAAVSAVVSVMSVVAVSAFADDTTTTTISSSLTNGFQSAVDDLITYAVAIVPICITAFGVTWAIKKCVNFFKGITGR